MTGCRASIRSARRRSMRRRAALSMSRAPRRRTPRAQSRRCRAKRKNAWLATGLTVAGVVLLLGALAALPEGVYWLPEALAEGDYYWRWLLSDLMPVLLGATTGIGCLFGAQHIRTSRRMRKKDRQHRRRRKIYVHSGHCQRGALQL